MNFDDPRKNDFFKIEVDDNVVTDDGEIVQALKITMPSLTDLRDVPNVRAKVVHSGRAILFEEPTVPFYFTHEPDYKIYQALDGATQESIHHHSAFVNYLNENEAYAITRTLGWLPTGMQCTHDFSMDCNIEDGQYLHKDIRPFSSDAKLGPSEEEKKLSQQSFHPVYWKARLVAQKRLKIKLKKKKGPVSHDLNSALRGMNLGGP
jgi:hypothetical protein